MRNRRINPLARCNLLLVTALLSAPPCLAAQEVVPDAPATAETADSRFVVFEEFLRPT